MIFLIGDVMHESSTVCVHFALAPKPIHKLSEFAFRTVFSSPLCPCQTHKYTSYFVDVAFHLVVPLPF